MLIRRILAFRATFVVETPDAVVERRCRTPLRPIPWCLTFFKWQTRTVSLSCAGERRAGGEGGSEGRRLAIPLVNSFHSFQTTMIPRSNESMGGRSGGTKRSTRTFVFSMRRAFGKTCETFSIRCFRLAACGDSTKLKILERRSCARFFPPAVVLYDRFSFCSQRKKKIELVQRTINSGIIRFC